MPNQIKNFRHWGWEVMRTAIKISHPSSRVMAIILFIIALVSAGIGIYLKIANQNVIGINDAVFFIILGFCFFIILFIISPWEVYKNDISNLNEQLESTRQIVSLCNKQKIELLNNPSTHIFAQIKKIILIHSTKEDKSYAQIDIYILNGSIFELDYDVHFKETELTVQHVNLGNLTILPTIYQKGTDKLGIGSFNITTIRQELAGRVIDDLYSNNKPIYSTWRFHMFIKVQLDQQSKEGEYVPEWDGIIDRRWEW